MTAEPIIFQSSCIDDSDTESLHVDEARHRILSAITPITDFEKLNLRDAL